MPTIIYVMIIILIGIFLLYAWAVMPRMFRKADRRSFMGHYYAHRGFHDNAGEAPENSIPAFKKAVEMGYGIELDVQLTKDEKVVVFHDGDLKRVCGVDAAVNSRTYEELQELCVCSSHEKIPLFEDVLKTVDGKVPMIVEIKMVDSKTRICELANELLLDYRGLYCVESFHPAAVRWFMKHRPELMRGQLSSNFRKNKGKKENIGEFAVHFLITDFFCRPDFVAYSCDHPNNIGFRLAKLLGALPVAWTVKSPEKLAEIKNKYKLFIFEGFRPEKVTKIDKNGTGHEGD